MTMNKKGSVAVFLTSILTTMIIVSIVFVQAASSICGASYADAVLELSGRSVLSEFDRRLKDEYGLFAFYGQEDTVASDIRMYASASFSKTYPQEYWGDGGWGTVDLLKLKLQRTKVNMAAYSLMDVDVFEKQIEDYMGFMLAEKGIDFIRSMWEKSGEAPAGEGEKSPTGEGDKEPVGAQGDKEPQRVQGEQKELKNKVEISSLPSQGNVRSGIGSNIVAIVEGGLPQMDDILKDGTKDFMVNEYIMSNFKYYIGDKKVRDTFFYNEVEYILFGKLKDKENLDRFKFEFRLMRVPLNFAYVWSDHKMRTTVLTLAEALGCPAAAGAIALAWATAEAENDVRLLTNGKRVSLLKDQNTWALVNLKSAVRTTRIKDDDGEVVDVYATEKKTSKCIDPPKSYGLSYSDYLRMFLFIEKRETKLMRAMDLIQLNFRKTYYGDFLIKDHYTGFSLEAVVSGKKYQYEQKY